MKNLNHIMGKLHIERLWEEARYTPRGIVQQVAKEEDPNKEQEVSEQERQKRISAKELKQIRQ